MAVLPRGSCRNRRWKKSEVHSVADDSCTVECGLALTYRRQTDSRKGDLQSNLGRRKVEMMMLLKLDQQLIPGLADVLQQVADLKDATAAANVVSLS